MSGELGYLGIGELQALYRSRRVSPVEVMDAVLERQERLEPRLNAFVTVLADPARAEARAAEARFARGEASGPLEGIPVSLKDIIDMAGVRTTAASRIWKDRVPERDATVTARLKAAGAILFGKANLLEFAYGIVHPDYGQVNNPWDTSRTSGGSSSGSAASVVAGIGCGSLGTDTGGSIRIPAAYCGAVGLKPTYGRVSRRGAGNLSWSLDHVGPLTRSVDDCARVLQVVAGHDPEDATSSRAPLPDYAAGLTGDVKGVRVGIVQEHLGPDLAPDVRTAFDAAMRLCADTLHVGECSIPLIEYADSALFGICLPEATVVHERRLSAHADDYAPMTRAQLEMGALVPVTDYLRAQQFRTLLRAEVDRAFERFDILAMPTVAFPAPAEDPEFGDAEAGASEARRTGPYDVTGHPAISVPCGFTGEGLPVGLQLVAPAFREDLLLQVAYAYEQRAGWFRMRPPLD